MAEFKKLINPPIKASEIDSESATSGQVLQADGNGGASWKDVSSVDEKELVKAVEAPLPTPTETSPYIVYNDNKAYVREHFSSVYLFAPAEEYTYYYIYEYQASANDTIQYGIAWTKLPISTISYTRVDNNNRYQYVAVGGDYGGAYRAVNQLTSGYSLKYFSTIEEAESYIKSSSAKYALYTTNIAMQYKNNIMFGGVWKFTFPIVRSNATNEVSYSTTGASNATIIYENANSNGSIDGTVVYGDVPQSRYKELAKIDEVLKKGEAVTSVNGQTGDVTVASYSLPVANSTTLGGVKPVSKTDAMTQEVGVDSTGKLFTTSGGGGSGGGSQIGGGYTFDCSSDMHTIHFWVLGTVNNVYGWHYISDDDYLTLTNVSLVVFEDMNAPSGELTTLTTNALYTFDGNPINTYSALSSAVGKLCYLRANCTIVFMD